MSDGTSTDKVATLLNPTSVAVLGARENPSGWTARIFANLIRFEFHGPVYPVNPNHERIWGVECFPDLRSLPTVPDHLVVMRAAASVPGILREAAAMGTRSATLYATGFSETGTDAGRALEAELREAIEDTGLAISGPNCLGNLSARARLLTLPDDRVEELVPGPVAMVGQSGTTTPSIARTLMDRGIDVSYVITSGNETGLVTADYIRYFVTDPEVRLIFCLVEAVRRAEDFLAACRTARDAGKPVVVLKMGVSEGGRRAALSHTGSLAGRVEAFDAVAGPAGVIRVESADGAVNVIDMLLHASEPRGENVGGLVYSGGVRGLAEDAADRHRVPLPEFAPATRARLRELLGEGQPISNPLDGNGYLTNRPLDDALKVVEAVYNDPGVDMVVFQEDLPPHEGANDANRRRAARVLATMEAIDKQLLGADRKPFALISPASYDLTHFSRGARLRFPHMACLNEPERAFRAIRAVMDYRRRCREAEAATAAAAASAAEAPAAAATAAATADAARAADATPAAEAEAPAADAAPVTPAASVTAHVETLRKRAADASGPFPLTEPESKALVGAFGVPLIEEELARTEQEAVEVAERMGFPVVVKGAAAALTHKSDAGAVRVNVGDAAAVQEACRDILRNVAAYDPGIRLEGWLVARMAPAGLDLVLGMQRDPEMGAVIMFGAGGVWLELVKDVAFGPPGITPAGAARLIDSTRVGRLLEGYRGEGPYDRDAAIDALVALGRLAAAAGDVVESLDINPFLVLPKGAGGVALDALAVIGRGAAR